MLINHYGSWAGQSAVPQSIVHAVRLLRAAGHERPTVLAYTPSYRNNPYTEVLYRGAWQHGIAPVPLQRSTRLDHLDVVQHLGAQLVLHLHWTNQLQQDDREATRAAHEQYRDQIVELRAQGARLVWTVHNRLPHECAHEDLEIELRRWLVDHVDVVHVMGPRTLDAVQDLYPIPPEKAVVVPHPSYVGVYPDTIDADQARFEMGLHPDDIALLLFGGIRPYKNVPLALEALDELLARGRGQVRLIVAGQPMGDWEGRAELEHALTRHPATRCQLGRIDETDVQRFFKAADGLLLPYTSIVNSGVLLLGTTFGLPVIGPATGEVGQILQEAELGVTFDEPTAAGVADAVESFVDGDRAAWTKHAAELTEQLAPDVVAARFRNEVLQVALGS